MATKIGPKTVDQQGNSKNLVFCIDAASYRSYRGEPTTNVVAYGHFPGTDTSTVSTGWVHSGTTKWSYRDGSQEIPYKGLGLSNPRIVTFAGIGYYNDTGSGYLNKSGGNQFTVSTSTSYTLSFWFRFTGGNASQLGLQKIRIDCDGGITDVTGNYGTAGWIPYTDVNDTEWHYYHGTNTSHGSTTATQLYFYAQNYATVSGGNYFEIAAVQIEPKDHPTPFATTNRRSGTVSGEILANGGFESWSSSSDIANWGEYTEGSSTIARSTDEYVGTYAVSFVIDASDNSVGIFQSGSVISGHRYRVTFWAKTNSGTPTLGVRTAPNSGNGVASNTIHETHTLTTSYAQYTTEFTAPAGDGNLILFRGAGASKTIFIDSVSLIELGATAVTNISGVGSESTALIGNFATFGQSLYKPTTRNVLATIDPIQGHVGGAYWDLDGTDEAIDCYDMNEETGTLAFWMKSTFSGSSSYPFGKQKGTETLAMSMHSANSPSHSGDFWVRNTAGGSSSVQTNAALNDGVWHQVVAMWGVGGLKIYVDGEFNDGDTTFTGHGNAASGDSNFGLGCILQSGGPGYECPGQFATLMVWSSQLTSKEVKDIYIAQKGRFGK